MAKKRVKSFKSSNKNNDKILFAFLTAFLSIIGFIIALIFKKNDKYVMFYAKQSLMVFIFAIIVEITHQIFVFIPIIGDVINVVLNISVIILWLISWIYALSNEEKEVPIIGKYARSIRL